MSDDIETLRSALDSADDDAHDALDRVIRRAGALQKAIDDRWAADLKAAKAIFAETGRTSGFPSVKDVVAFYVAEVERLEKELSTANQALAERWNEIAFKNMQVCVEATERERGSLRAKLDRAREALERLVDIQKYSTGWDNGVTDATGAINEADYWHGEEMDRARAVLSELSADAPAQQPQRNLRVLTDAELAEHLSKLEKQWDRLIAALEESGGCSGSPGEWLAEEMDAARAEQKRRSQQPQISDEDRKYARIRAEQATSDALNAEMRRTGVPPL